MKLPEGLCGPCADKIGEWLNKAPTVYLSKAHNPSEYWTEFVSPLFRKEAKSAKLVCITEVKPCEHSSQIMEYTPRSGIPTYKCMDCDKPLKPVKWEVCL